MHKLGLDIAYETIKPTQQELERFFECVDVANIISEASQTAGNQVDDGPIGYWANQKSYRGATSTLAEKMGMQVLNYLVPEEEFSNTIHNIQKDQQVQYHTSQVAQLLNLLELNGTKTLKEAQHSGRTRNTSRWWQLL